MSAPSTRYDSAAFSEDVTPHELQHAAVPNETADHLTSRNGLALTVLTYFIRHTPSYKPGIEKLIKSARLGKMPHAPGADAYRWAYLQLFVDRYLVRVEFTHGRGKRASKLFYSRVPISHERFNGIVKTYTPGNTVLVEHADGQCTRQEIKAAEVYCHLGPMRIGVDGELSVHDNARGKLSDLLAEVEATEADLATPPPDSGQPKSGGPKSGASSRKSPKRQVRPDSGPPKSGPPKFGQPESNKKNNNHTNKNHQQEGAAASGHRHGRPCGPSVPEEQGPVDQVVTGDSSKDGDHLTAHACEDVAARASDPHVAEDQPRVPEKPSEPLGVTAGSDHLPAGRKSRSRESGSDSRRWWGVGALALAEGAQPAWIPYSSDDVRSAAFARLGLRRRDHVPAADSQDCPA